MIVYAVYINGDNDGEFPTRQDARDYIERYITGTMETYRNSRAYVLHHTEIKIEEVEYD